MNTSGRFDAVVKGYCFSAEMGHQKRPLKADIMQCYTN